MDTTKPDDEQPTGCLMQCLRTAASCFCWPVDQMGTCLIQHCCSPDTYDIYHGGIAPDQLSHKGPGWNEWQSDDCDEVIYQDETDELDDRL